MPKHPKPPKSESWEDWLHQRQEKEPSPPPKKEYVPLPPPKINPWHPTVQPEIVPTKEYPALGDEVPIEPIVWQRPGKIIQQPKEEEKEKPQASSVPSFADVLAGKMKTPGIIAVKREDIQPKQTPKKKKKKGKPQKMTLGSLLETALDKGSASMGERKTIRPSKPVNPSLPKQPMKHKRITVEALVRMEAEAGHAIVDEELMRKKKKRQPTKLKKIIEQDRAERTDESLPFVGSYCTQLVTRSLDHQAKAMIMRLTELQQRLRDKDVSLTKKQRGKRLVAGLHEALKYAKVGRVRMLIVAVNLESVTAEGGLEEMVSKVVQAVKEHDTPVVYALSRRGLGKAAGRKSAKLSCVAILNPDGAYEMFQQVIEMAAENKKVYDEWVAKGEEGVFQYDVVEDTGLFSQGPKKKRRDGQGRRKQ